MKEFFRIGFLVWGIGMCVSSAVLLIVGSVMMLNRVKWKEEAVPVEAQITGYVVVDAGEGGENKSDALIYSYSLDGKEYTGRAALSNPNEWSAELLLNRGADAPLIPMTVLVNPAEPDVSRRDSFADIYLLPTVLVGLSIFEFLIALGILFYARRLKHA